MNKTGHSRLLKYIIADNSTKMDEPTIHKLVIEDITPTAIKSELPSNCPMRQQESKANETLTDDHKIKTYGTITVNVTDEDKNIAAEKEDELKSKIPIPSFRRVKNKNKDNLQVPQPMPRGDISITNVNQIGEIPNDDNKRNTVKDFDRLFQEINDKGRITSMDLEILRDITPEDPEKVDGFFEEIIHAYEEKKKEINEPNIAKNNANILVDNNTQFQVNQHTNPLNDNKFPTENFTIDTPTRVISNFDEVLNSYSLDKHEHIEHNKPIKPTRSILNKNTNIMPSATINTEIAERILNNDPDSCNVNNVECANPPVLLNSEITVQPIDQITTEADQPIDIVNHEVIPRSINANSFEPIVPLNTDVILNISNDNSLINAETTEEIDILNNKINVCNVESSNPIVPLNKELNVHTISIVSINAETTQDNDIVNNEIIPKSLNVEFSEPIVPLNTKEILQPTDVASINAENIQSVGILNNKIIPQPIYFDNVNASEPIVPLNREVIVQPIDMILINKESTQTGSLNNEEKPTQAIDIINSEVIIQPNNVDNAEFTEPIVPLNTDITVPMVSIKAKTEDPIIALNDDVIKKNNIEYVNSVQHVVPLKKEINIETIENESEPLHVVYAKPINTETAECIVPLNNELVLENIHVRNPENSEPIVPNKISITTELSAPIVPEVEINKLGNTINIESPKYQNNVIVVEKFADNNIEQLDKTFHANLIQEKNNVPDVPILHNKLNDDVEETNQQISKNRLSIVTIEPETVKDVQEIGVIKADYIVTEHVDESAQHKLLINNATIEQCIQGDIITCEPTIEQNILGPVVTNGNLIHENIEVHENLKDNKPSRIPRRFNNNIKVYPTADETYNKVELFKSDTTKNNLLVVNDAEKTQSKFKSIKSFEEPQQDEIKTNNTKDTYLNSNDKIKIKDNVHVIDFEINTSKPEIVNVIEKSNSQDDIIINNIENINKIRRFKSMPTIDNDKTPKISRKSVAEIDLGEKIKGRVGSLVQKMKSIENSKHVSKDLINKVDVPKKQSVLDRVAMFERKTVLSKMEAAKDRHTRAAKQAEVLPEVKTEEMYKEQIEELKNAKNKYDKAPNMPVIELNNGQNMPVLAIGTALVEPVLIKYVIEAAIDLGYKAIDTAFIYGKEKLIGEAIKAKIDDGTVKRENLFIINKLWSTFHKPDLVETACRASLEQMGLDYFDLYLIHCPMSFKEGKDVVPKIANVVQYSSSDYLDAWRAMETLVKKGLAKSIGVSNFNSQQLGRILEKGTIKPVVNQVESHPYLNQQRLNEFCAIRDIRLSCFATLGSKGTPSELKSSDMAVLDDPLVKVLAAAIGKTPAQMLIRYQLEQERNAVVKTSSAAHLWENLQALTFKLTTEEIEALNALNKNKRYFGFIGMGDTHKNYPFTIPF